MTFFTTDGAFFAILFTIVLGFDENSTRTKAKTRAIMPDKVDKFPIHFYVVVSSYGTYVHSKMDNQTGNISLECVAVASCHNFPLRSAYFVDGESASAVFFLQMTYQMLRLFLVLLW
jgi:hypothetical protein